MTSLFLASAVAEAFFTLRQSTDVSGPSLRKIEVQPLPKGLGFSKFFSQVRKVYDFCRHAGKSEGARTPCGRSDPSELPQVAGCLGRRAASTSSGNRSVVALRDRAHFARFFLISETCCHLRGGLSWTGNADQLCGWDSVIKADE